MQTDFNKRQLQPQPWKTYILSTFVFKKKIIKLEFKCWNTLMLSMDIEEFLLPRSRDDSSWKDISLFPIFLSTPTIWVQQSICGWWKYYRSCKQYISNELNLIIFSIYYLSIYYESWNSRFTKFLDYIYQIRESCCCFFHLSWKNFYRSIS